VSWRLAVRMGLEIIKQVQGQSFQKLLKMKIAKTKNEIQNGRKEEKHQTF